MRTASSHTKKSQKQDENLGKNVKNRQNTKKIRKRTKTKKTKKSIDQNEKKNGK